MMGTIYKELPTKWSKVREHIELIAALLSGVLILIGWLLSSQEMESLSIVFFLLAFVIGGYAKAKEGVEKRIEGHLIVEGAKKYLF